MKKILFIGIVGMFLVVLGFECVNFPLTFNALDVLLGNIAILGIPWSLILTFAFTGIDPGVVFILVNPESVHHKRYLYILAAWLLAAIFNAALSWVTVKFAPIPGTDLAGIGLGIFMLAFRLFGILGFSNAVAKYREIKPIMIPEKLQNPRFKKNN